MLNQKIIIQLNREYGPFLDKPSLPKGIYNAQIQGINRSKQITAFNITYQNHQYYILPQDTTYESTI